MKNKHILCLTICYFLSGICGPSLFAQNNLGNEPLVYFLSEDKSQWIKFGSYLQLWGRINQNNPGSTVNDKLETTTTDLSLRRFRLGISAAPWENTFVSFQLGVNNLNYLSPRGTSIDLLDAYLHYDFSKYIAIGAGKSAWNGLSRFTSPSSSKLMAYDLSFVALPTLDSTDDLIRKLNLFTKGKVGHFDYRFVIAKPLSVRNSNSFDSEALENIARFTDNRPNLQYSGYLKYEFLDPENNSTPFQVGTYLGSKKVLNLGMGFTAQSDALWSLESGDERYHDMKLFATDIFIDLPLNTQKKNAITAYLGYFNFDFGPNYIRLLGSNNPVNGVLAETSSFNGRGNIFPVSGTGEVLLTQFGYLFSPLGGKISSALLQPYVSSQYSNFEGLAKPIFQYDIGINWYLNGHLSKFVMNAQNRPILLDNGQGAKTTTRKWMFVLQYQFRLD